jgi:hypothetical protein
MSDNKANTPRVAPSKVERSLSTNHHISTMNQSGGNQDGQSSSGQPSGNAGTSGSQGGGDKGSGKS